MEAKDEDGTRMLQCGEYSMLWLIRNEVSVLYLLFLYEISSP